VVDLVRVLRVGVADNTRLAVTLSWRASSEPDRCVGAPFKRPLSRPGGAVGSEVVQAGRVAEHDLVSILVGEMGEVLHYYVL
jgi:hypothetical protein